MELFLTFYTYVCYVTQISLEAFLVTITDTGHLGSSQDALSLSQSVNCGCMVQTTASGCNSSLCHLSTPLLLEEKKKHHCRTYLIRWCSSFLIDWITSKLLHQENLDLFSPCFQDCIFFVAYDWFALSVYLGSI